MRRVGWPLRCTCSHVRLNFGGWVWSLSWRRGRNQLLGISLGESFSSSTSPTTSNMLKRWSFYSWLKGINMWLSTQKCSNISIVSTPYRWMKSGDAQNARTTSVGIFISWWLRCPSRTLQPWWRRLGSWRRWRWRWKPNTHTSREWEGHLGTGIRTKREGNPILGLISSLKGLGGLLPNRVRFSDTSVGDYTWGMSAPNW